MFKLSEIIDFGDHIKEESRNEFEEEGKPLINLADRTPWIDKYRPRCLKDVVYQTEVVQMLQKCIDSSDMQHMLLYGPPGTGKTSSILALAMEMFGPKNYHDRVLELNASDERGINIVRNQIVTFAKTSLSTSDPNFPSPKFKIIVLDEADAMTSEAQSALRKTMEDYSNITRFCFICNYINKIIDPIVSRCVKIRFKPLKEKYMVDRLLKISNEENLKIKRPVLNHLVGICDGDLRTAIMYLQNMKYLEGSIGIDEVNEIVSSIPKYFIDQITKLTLQGTDENAEQIHTLTKSINSSGYSMSNITRQLNHIVIFNKNLSDKQKAEISVRFSTIEKYLIDGANEYLQLLNLLMFIRSVYLNGL